MSTCLVVMGVSGVGKSTMAVKLAERLDWPTAEGDDFHPAANVAKMGAGLPLSDIDREPWLRSIRDWISERADQGSNCVVACSALKRKYRDVLREARAHVEFVHLKEDPEVIRKRIIERGDHFMPAELLPSQFETFEPLGADEPGITVPITGSPDDIADGLISALGLGTAD